MAHLLNLTSVSIPESITAITTDTFTDCPQLAAIIVAPNNPTYASIDGLLYNKALTRVLLCPESAEGVVSLPDQTDAVPASALSHCANLSTLLVGQDNAVYTSINGNLYSKDASTLVACPGGIGETLTLPKQTSAIGPDALAGITTLKSIVVLGNITAIDPSAFNDQAKQSTTIALPGGEDYEARKAVWQQAGFKNFATPANPGDTQTPDQPSNPGDKPDKPTDSSKPASGFTYKLLEDYTLEASWTGDLTPESNPSIPPTAQLAGVTYTVSALAPKAFAGTALTTIDIPASITTIGDQAFANCPKLTRIVTHSNTLTVAPTALEGCTNLELWCPYNEAETYPWSIGLFATNNHIKAYGLPASQQALTLEVGQSANLFEPGTLQAPDPSKTVYAYEATCLSVSQEGTITAKAPGTTTISTSIELDQTPLTHTTRTISVVAPTTPTTPEQPETPTPTPPIAQPITPYYPPNLATPTQASAPLYSRGGIQPRAYVPKVSVTVPTAPIITIDAAGQPKLDDPKNTVNIESTTTEPIRATSITCTEQPGAKQLLTNLDTAADVRANTKVNVTDKGTPPNTSVPPFALSTTGTTWPAPAGSAAPFRIEAGSTTTPATRSIAFGLTIPDNATYSYQPSGVDFASVAFTFGLLDPVAPGLTLSSTTPSVGDTITATPAGQVSSTKPIYTWYELTNAGDTPTRILQSTSSNTYTLAPEQNGEYVCCALSDGSIDTPTAWASRPAYSDVTAPVTPGLKSYTWPALSAISADLSINGENSTYYSEFHNYLIDPTDTGTGTGQHKIIDLEKGAGTLEVRIVGINHDEKSDGTGKAGLTFMATHRLPDDYNQQMYTSTTNTNGWQGSPARAALNNSDGAVWKLMPPDLVTAIKPVNKYTNNKGSNATGDPVATVPPDKLWIPSYAELSPSVRTGWTGKAWLAKESSQKPPDAQYEFFKGKVTMDGDGYNNLSDILKSVCLDSGLASGSGASAWWERSCYPDGAHSFVNCYTNGNPSNGNAASATLGIVLGFSI